MGRNDVINNNGHEIVYEIEAIEKATGQKATGKAKTKVLAQVSRRMSS